MSLINLKKNATPFRCRSHEGISSTPAQRRFGWTKLLNPSLALVTLNTTPTTGNFQTELYEQIRREAFGEDIGQNSWLTANEQDRFLSWLDLSPGKALLPPLAYDMRESVAFNYDLDMVRRRYRWLAPIYPFLELVFLLPRGIRNKALERVGLTAGDKVLEIGCGTGRNLGHLVAAVGAEGRVYGVDYSEAMLGESGGALPPERLAQYRAVASGCCSTQPAGNGRWCAVQSVLFGHAESPWCSSTSVEVSATW